MTTAPRKQSAKTADKLRQIIRRHGIRKLARETKINAGQLSRWVNKRTGANLYHYQIDKICRATGHRMKITRIRKGK